MSTATPHVVPNTYEEINDPNYDKLHFSSPHNRLEMDSDAVYSDMEGNALYNKFHSTFAKSFIQSVGRDRSKHPKSKRSAAMIVCAAITLVIYAVLCTVAIAVGFWEIAKLKSEMARLESDMITLSSTFEVEATKLMSETRSLQQVISTQPNASVLQVRCFL